MGGLGIAAGAFEGDNARKEQAQRDQQLALQAQAQALQAQQAKMVDDRAREGMALDQKNREAEMALNQQRMGEQVRQFDAGLGVDQKKQKEQVRQFDAGLQMQEQEQQRRAQAEQFGQEQATKQSDWADILNSQKVKEADLQYQELLKLRDEEEKQRLQRDQVAKSAVGQMIRAAYEGGGVPGKNFLSASQMDYFRKADPRFQGLQSVTWGDDGQGNKVLQMSMQGPDGQPATEIITPEQQFLALSSIYGEKMANGIFGRTDKSAYNAYLGDRGGSLANKDSRSMSKIDELNYAALAKQNAELGGDPALEEKMKAIESRYGIVPAEKKQAPSQEEQLIKARSIAAEVKKANPYASKDQIRELVRRALTSAGIQVN